MEVRLTKRFLAFKEERLSDNEGLLVTEDLPGPAIKPLLTVVCRTYLSQAIDTNLTLNDSSACDHSISMRQG